MSDMLSRPNAAHRWRRLAAGLGHPLLMALLCGVVSLHVVVPALRAPTPFGIVRSADKVTILDFPSHFNFVRSVWGDGPSPGVSAYSPEYHLRITSAWAGEATEGALPFGYSPTMVVLLGPLAPLTHAGGFALFALLGLLAAWWQTRPRDSRMGWAGAAFLTPLGLACFILGQTAILTGAGLLFLFLRARDDATGVRRLDAASALVLWALTAKPPLALTAGVVLLGVGRWRTVLAAVGLTAVTTLALTPLLGAGWPADYLHMLATYNRVDADPAFVSSFAPEHMATLRGILTVDLGLPDDQASRAGSLVWIAGLGVLALAALRRRLGEGRSWAAGLLLFLLFSPHVSSTEVLQVALVVPFCLPATGPVNGWDRRLVLVAAPLLPLLSPAFTGNRMVLFGLLALLLAWVALRGESPGADPSPGPPGGLPST